MWYAAVIIIAINIMLFLSKLCKKEMRVFALHVVAQCSKILLKGIFKASHLDTIRNHMKQEHEDTGTEIYQDVRVNPGRVKLLQITFKKRYPVWKGIILCHASF